MMSLRKLPATLTGREPFYLIATWFQSGRIRPASGSWGSLAALPFCWFIKYFGGDLVLALFALVMFGLGLLSIKLYAQHSKNLDPSEVVIDEVVGMAIVWLFTPPQSWLLAGTGFVLFRLFDSIKRGPVGWCDKNIKGPAGVIVDDVVAGFLAGICIMLLIRFFY